MSQEERYGSRDLSYSTWHRTNSVCRFVGIEKAQLLSMIDMDASLWVEFQGKFPLGFIETAVDCQQSRKSTTITEAVAKKCNLPAYLVLYQKSLKRNPANDKWPDIEKFRVKRLWPEPEIEFSELTPEQWARSLVKIREYSANQFDQIIRARA